MHSGETCVRIDVIPQLLRNISDVVSLESSSFLGKRASKFHINQDSVDFSSSSGAQFTI